MLWRRAWHNDRDAGVNGVPSGTGDMTELGYGAHACGDARSTTPSMHRVTGLLMAAGGLLAVAGSFVPWASIVGMGGETGVASYSVSGLSYYNGDATLGILVIALAVTVVLAGTVAILRPASAPRLLGCGSGVAVVVALLGTVEFVAAGSLLGIGDVMTGLQPDTP